MTSNTQLTRKGQRLCGGLQLALIAACVLLLFPASNRSTAASADSPGPSTTPKLDDVTAPGLGLQAKFTHPGPFTAPSASYYVALAIGAGDLSSPPSAPTGVFTFGLVPGQ